MKLGKKRAANTNEVFSSGKTATNQGKRIILMALVIVATAAMIVWVYMMGQKATETVTVIMTSQNIYKNQQITEELIQPYDMVKAEFEKYSIVDSNGIAQRRLLTWDERGLIIGAFAAYPLQANTTPDYRCFYTSKIDNSDSVMYSFPGKEIVALSVGTNDLQYFKSFLQPGDRVNITAVYTEDEKIEHIDDLGNKESENVTSYRSEVVFKDIMIADLLNNSGDSILDIYEDYKGRSVQQQASLDASSQFQESVEPKSLLVALTPEELEMYYKYLSKDGIEFRMSLPQRIQ